MLPPKKLSVFEVTGGPIGKEIKFRLGERVHVKALQILPTVYAIKGIYIGRENNDHVVRYHIASGLYCKEEDIEKVSE